MAAAPQMIIRRLTEGNADSLNARTAANADSYNPEDPAVQEIIALLYSATSLCITGVANCAVWLPIRKHEEVRNCLNGNKGFIAGRPCKQSATVKATAVLLSLQQQKESVPLFS